MASEVTAGHSALDYKGNLTRKQELNTQLFTEFIKYCRSNWKSYDIRKTSARITFQMISYRPKGNGEILQTMA
jgi:hypothetical protein